MKRLIKKKKCDNKVVSKESSSFFKRKSTDGDMFVKMFVSYISSKSLWSPNDAERPTGSITKVSTTSEFNVLFLFPCSAKKKEEEDEDDMADLQAWAAN